MPSETIPQHRLHPRQYDRNTFVYPVVSRRSHGLSIGINLNPDKVCNFDCIYCQVDRRSEAVTKFVGMDQLLRELETMLSDIVSGAIYSDPKFADVPQPLRRLNDIAFSGDGEPTTFKNFDEIVTRVAELKSRFDCDDVKLVLITNASMFHRENVQEGLEILDRNNGEIWAKLDAGTEEYYQLIERTKIPFRRVLDNITLAARQRPLVVQSLFMHVSGKAPSTEEIDAYIARLNEIQEAGGRLKLVQVYTVARQPAESFVTPLSNPQVDHIAQRVREETGIPAEEFYS